MDNSPIALNDVEGLSTNKPRPWGKRRYKLFRINLFKKMGKFFKRAGEKISRIADKTWEGIKKIGESLSNLGSGIDWNKTFNYLLKPWGNIDLHFFNRRFVSRQHRFSTRLINPFHVERGVSPMNGTSFDNPLKGVLGLSFGFRLGNIVLFDIQLGRTARWEDYFPGRDDKFTDGSNQFFKFSFFYIIRKGSPAYSGYPEDYDLDPSKAGGPHPLFIGGKSWMLPCTHGRIFRGMGGKHFMNDLPPNKAILPINIIKSIFDSINYMFDRRNKRYKWF